MSSALTDIYGKIHYIKKRIKKANHELVNNYIDDDIFKRKLKHYDRMLKDIERDFVLLPNAYTEIINLKKIINKELKEYEKFFNSEIIIDWKTGEIKIQ